MTLLESGPAKTDFRYWFIVGLAFLGGTAWCVYDGAYAYVEQNRAEAKKELAKWSEPPFDLGERPTKEDLRRLREQRPREREEIRELLGEPLSLKADAPRRDVELYASVWGVATLPVSPSTGRILYEQLPPWRAWKHSPDDIQVQYYMAIAIGLLALYMFSRAWRAATLRCVIDEQGMTYGGKRVAFEDMVSLRDYNPKGWVDLYYRAGDGREKKLRIDNQKIGRFAEIADLISKTKGWENPVRAALVEPGEKAAEPTLEEAEPGPTADHSADQERQS